MKLDAKIEKASWSLFLLCWIGYAILCMSRNTYSATMAAMIAEGIFSKSQAGVITSGFYLLYGAAQLFGSKLIDRVSPVIILSVGMVGTAVACVGMCFSHSYIVMLILWSICGLSQFGIWLSTLQIIAEYLIPNHRNKGIVYIAFAYCVGMLVNYLMGAVILGMFNWQTMFVVNAFILVATFIIWVIYAPKTLAVLDKAEKTEKEIKRTEVEEKTENSVGLGRLFVTSGLLVLLVPAFIRSCLDLGIKSWVPTMIMESYGVSASFASTIAAVLTVVNLGGVFITNYLYPRKVKNAVNMTGLLFMVTVPMNVALLLTGSISLRFVILLLILSTTMMYAGHQRIDVIIPAFFARFQKTGSVASIVNSIASFGIVVSSVAFGFMADHFGWTGTIWSWVILTVVATITTFSVSKRWGKFFKE